MINSDLEILPPLEVPTNLTPASNDVGINALLAQAVQNNVNVEILERLLVIRRELRAEAAKEAFDEAMRAFQGECQPIVKSRPVKTDNASYAYAPIEDLQLHTQALRAKYGFSYTIHTETFEKHVSATCVIKHTSGHQETSPPYKVPVGAGTRLMSNTQVYAAAITFATRYAFKYAFGLTIIGEDNEEHVQKRIANESKPPTDAELATLLSLIEASGFSADEIAKKFKVSSLTDVKRITCIYITEKLQEVITKRGGVQHNVTKDGEEVIPGLND